MILKDRQLWRVWQADGGRGQLQGALGQPARRHRAVGGGTLRQESFIFTIRNDFI